MGYEYKPGDVLFFAGRGPLSRLIALVTLPTSYLIFCLVAFFLVFTAAGLFYGASAAAALLGFGFILSRRISHVGILVEHKGELLLLESTSLCPDPCVIKHHLISGVQAHQIGSRIHKYNGDVYVMTLNPFLWSLSRHETARLEALTNEFIGMKYSTVGAAMAGTRVLKWYAAPLRKTLHKFCSELVAYMLKAVRRMPADIHSATLSPAALMRVMERSEYYLPAVKVK